jgi:hypothetical protein
VDEPKKSNARDWPISSTEFSARVVTVRFIPRAHRIANHDEHRISSFHTMTLLPLNRANPFEYRIDPRQFPALQL